MDASITNPLWQSVVPGGMNPTGSSIAMPGTGTSSSGANAFLPMSATGTSPSAPVTANPFMGGAVPGASATGATPLGTLSPWGGATQAPTPPGINTGGYASSGGALLPSGGMNATGGKATDPFGFGSMTDKDKSRMYGELKKTYGDGTAHMIMDFLQSGAGYNQQAINNLLASLQPGIERGQENLMEQFSASGNRFGSGAQIGLADYLSQVNLNEGQLVTQMYEHALDNFMNVMMGTSGQTAGRIANSPSTWDSIMGGLGLAKTAAGGITAGLGAAGGGAGAGILAGLAAI